MTPVTGTTYNSPMPYKSLDLKRERDAAYKCRVRKAARDREVAARDVLPGANDFGEWLSSVLETTHDFESPRSWSTSPTTILAEHLGKDDAMVGRWRRGAPPKSEDTIFAIGVALRECGVAWSSGAYALRKRGFWGAELSYLDFVDRCGHHDLVVAYLNASNELAQLEGRRPARELDQAREQLARVMQRFGPLEQDLHRDWKRRANSSEFGLLGAVHHLVFESHLDPRDVDDAADALVQRWATRTPSRQNLRDLIPAMLDQQLKDAQ